MFLLVVLVLTFFYLFLCQPQINKISFYSEQYLADKRNQLVASQKVLAELQAIKDIYQNINDELRLKVKKILPSSPELSNLYYSLDNIAQKFGFKVTSVAINAVKNEIQEIATVSTENTVGASKATAKLLEVNMVVDGSGYQNVKEFVNTLTHNLRIFDIKTFSYSPKNTSLNFIFKTYYLE